MRNNADERRQSVDDEIAEAVQRLRRYGHDAFQRDLALVRQLAQSLETLNTELMHEIDMVLESYSSTRAKLLMKLKVAADKAAQEKEDCPWSGNLREGAEPEGVDRLRSLNLRSRSA